MKRIQLFIILCVVIITYYGCRRNDLSLEDDKLVNSPTGNIELLKKAFRSDSIAFNRSGNISELNFRQSLQRVIYWEYAVIKDKSTYVPVRQLLPEGNVTENGGRFLPHRAWLVIEKDSVNNKFAFKMLTLISEKDAVDYENFDGISLTEDYFSRKAIEAVKYGDDINPFPKLEIIKLMSTGTLSLGSVCSPVVSAGKRCGPGLKCEYIKVAYVCTGNYCSDRYEWMCVRNWATLDPDNPEPVNPPYTGPWPELPGGGGSGETESNDNGNKEIIDSLQGYPCAQAILKKLPNLENKIAQWLKKTFNNSDYDLTFRAITTMSDTLDGYYFPNNAIATAQTITLNGNMLLKASQEYIIATMYHEALHSFLYMEELRLKEQFGITYTGYAKINLAGSTKFLKKHQEYSTLLSDLANAIKEFNPAISDYDAMALAKGGVISDMNTIEGSINYNHKNGKTGTKCNP
ncbi:Uncharacterised protein [Sphingobacterium spiritivorum]|uniref:Uncharacterized protein n=1 Tax=Sphingobacterium spiritivorum TaxID=258 RepID=A0A380CUL8_SPHSI|nr:hypothetical protein [Sphingobacterium spiritivorum]SUJ29113.1 Uncharacterised protein [Sphingobacterium spiritivorum]